MYLWWNLGTLYFTRMPGERYCRRLWSLLLSRFGDTIEGFRFALSSYTQWLCRRNCHGRYLFMEWKINAQQFCLFVFYQTSARSAWSCLIKIDVWKFSKTRRWVLPLTRCVPSSLYWWRHEQGQTVAKSIKYTRSRPFSAARYLLLQIWAPPAVVSFFTTGERRTVGPWCIGGFCHTFPALLMTSLIQTDGHKMAALTIVF